MDTIKQEYLAERVRLQKETMREAIERDKCEAGVRALVKRIGSHPANAEEKSRLQNSFTFFATVRCLEECGQTDEQITTAISDAVEQCRLKRPDNSREGAEKVAAALCALELQELGLATTEDLQRIRYRLASGAIPVPRTTWGKHAEISPMFPEAPDRKASGAEKPAYQEY